MAVAVLSAAGAVASGDAGPAAGRETGILTALEIPWHKPWLADDRVVSVDRSRGLSSEDWERLVAESRETRERLSDDAVDAFMASRDITASKVKTVAELRGLDVGDVLEVVRKHVGILQHAEAWGAANVRIGEAEIDAYVDDVLKRLEVRALLLPSDRLAPVVDDPRDDELVAFFDERQDPANGGPRYVEPARVRFEYIATNRHLIKAKLEYGRSTLERYWRNNRDLFPETEEFDAVAEVVEADYREVAASALARDVMTEISAALRRPWGDAVEGADGFAVAPQIVQEPSYLHTIAAAASARFGVPVGVYDTGLVTQREAGALDGIGRSRWVNRGSSGVVFPHVAFRVEGLHEPAGAGDWALALYEPTGLLVEAEAMRGPVAWYIGRVVEMSCPGTAASLGSAYEEVVADFKRHVAHQRIEQLAASVTAEARRVGLDAAWADSRGEQVAAREVHASFGGADAIVSPEPFARRVETGFEFELTHVATKPVTVAAFPDDPTFVGRCFALAAEVEQEARRRPGMRLVGKMPIAEDGGWAIVEFKHMHHPPPLEPQHREMVRQRLRIEAFYRRLREWFDPVAIRERTESLATAAAGGS